MIESGSGLVQDPVLGRITVYREFKPRTDSIEYTVFFRLEDNGCKECGHNPKLRLDLEIMSEELAAMVEDKAEIEIRHRIYKAIINGKYKKATEAV